MLHVAGPRLQRCLPPVPLSILRHAHRRPRICRSGPQVSIKRGRRRTEVTAAPPLTLSPHVWKDLVGNRIFMTGLVSWSIAQILKIFTEYVKSGRFDVRALVMAGGMPSSHSSVCVAVTTSVALQQGLGSALFAVAFCFTSIVMYDAAGIRRHAGYQAKILNQLMSGLRPDLGDQTALKEVLGHSRREVLGGAVVGLLVGMFWPM